MNNIHFPDFYFGDGPLTKQECLHNLNKVEGVYSSILSSGSFHLSPGEILKWSNSHVLDCNIRALLAHLYYHFEVRHYVQNIKSLSGPHQKQEDTTGLVRRPNLLRRSKMLTRAENLPKIGASSSSTVQPMSTVFKAPVRNSQSLAQFAVLSHFNQRSMELGKSRQTQSSPSIQVSATPSVPPKLSKDGLITASADNLMIREQMIAKKLQQSVSRRSATSTPSLPQSSMSLHQSSSPDLTPLRRSFTVNKQHTRASANAAGLPIIDNDEMAECSTADESDGHSPGAPMVRPTEDKAHVSTSPPPTTPIEDKARVSTSPSPSTTPIEDKVHVTTSPPPPTTPIEDKSRSTSSNSSTITVMQLSFFPKQEVTELSFDKDKLSSIPVSAIEQLQQLLNKFKKSRALKESQQIGQEVHRSYMHMRMRRHNHSNTESNSVHGNSSQAASMRNSTIDKHDPMTKHQHESKQPTEERHLIDDRNTVPQQQQAPNVWSDAGNLNEV